MAIRQRTIALGTLGSGTSTDQETSFRILDRFTELGGTVLYTANNYAFRVDGANGDESEAESDSETVAR